MCGGGGMLAAPQVPVHRHLRGATRRRSPRGVPGPGQRFEASGGDRSVICFGTRPGRISARRRRVPVPAAATPGDPGVLRGLRTVSAAGLVCLRPDGRGRLIYRMRIDRGRQGERRGMFEADYAGLITAAHHQMHALAGKCGQVGGRRHQGTLDGSADGPVVQIELRGRWRWTIRSGLPRSRCSLAPVG